MTLFLASVVSAHEAALACAGGADTIDFVGPDRTGSLDLPRLRAVVAAVEGRCRISARLDRAGAPDTAVGLATAAADAGVDMIRVDLGTDGASDAAVKALAGLSTRVSLIGVLRADTDLAGVDLASLAAHGFAAAMLDTIGSERLLTRLDLTALRRFAARCAAARLGVGFAGALEAPDVERLLLLTPDVLGFRAALTRAGEFNPARIETIRTLIPRQQDAAREPASSKLIGRPGSGEPTDRVFVHDLVLPVSIGAYDREREGMQRVRFNVDADVRRATHGAHDMRDVFSYDLVIDSIRLILDRGHVGFVEMLAEEIAQAVLSHARVLRVRVRVEKLDLGAGGVGVEIARDRASQAATVHRLFAEPATGNGPA